MKKFRFYIIAVAVLLMIVMAVIALRSYYLFLKEPVSPLAGAIPAGSAIIVKAGNLNSFTKIVQSSSLAGLLERNKAGYGFSALAQISDSLGILSSFFKEITGNNEFIIAVVPDKENSPEILYATSVGKIKPSRFNNEIKSLFPDIKSEKINNKYTDFYRITSGETEIWYFVFRGILSFSYSREILSQSLNTLVAKKNLLDDPTFERLIETSGKRVDAVMMINNHRLMEMALQSTENPLDFTGSPFTGWTILDLKVEEERVLMDGFTASGLNSDLFTGQEPLEESLLKFLPRETAFGLILSVSDQELFTGKFYQSDTMQLAGYDSANRIASREIFRRSEHLNSWIGQSVCLAAMPGYFSGNRSAVLILISLKNPDSARIALKPYLEPFNDEFRILRAGNLTSRLWGSLFALKGKQYCFISGNVVAISPSAQLLQQYVSNYKSGILLGSAKQYPEITELAALKSNLFIYLKPSIGKNYLKLVNKGDKYRKSSGWTGIPAGTEFICMQYSAGGPMLYTHAFALLKKDDAFKFTAVKKTPLAISDKPVKESSTQEPSATAKTDRIENNPSGLRTLAGPFIVHGDKASEKRIAIFTEKDQLQMFTAEGTLLWTFHCKGNPVGLVNEVDFHRNGRLQYLVATDSHLHLLDTEGSELKISPIKAPGGISGSIAVFDYDRKRDYRVVYQGKDKKLYNMTLQGESLPDWQKPETNGTLAGPARFFRTAGKDYIIFSDKQGRMKITDRRGKVRIKLPEGFRKSINSDVFMNASNSKGSFLMASADGKLAYIDGSGKVSESGFGNHGANPYFDYLDFDGDNSADFIFAGKERITVYNKMKKVIGEMTLKNADFGRPFITDFRTKEKWLAVRDKKTGEIIAMNDHGKQIGLNNLKSDRDPLIIQQGKSNNPVLVTIRNGKPEYTPLHK